MPRGFHEGFQGAFHGSGAAFAVHGLGASGKVGQRSIGRNDRQVFVGRSIDAGDRYRHKGYGVGFELGGQGEVCYQIFSFSVQRTFPLGVLQIRLNSLQSAHRVAFEDAQCTHVVPHLGEVLGALRKQFFPRRQGLQGLLLLHGQLAHQIQGVDGTSFFAHRGLQVHFGHGKVSFVQRLQGTLFGLAGVFAFFAAAA